MHLIQFLFLLLALLFPITSFLPSTNASDLITETCKHTIYIGVCTSTLHSNPLSPTADLHGLTAISIAVTSAYAKETAAYMRKLKYEARHANGMEKWRLLSDCLAGYEEGVDELEQAAEALQQRAYDTVNFMLAGATTNADTCESGFQESPGMESPVTERNEYLMKLCSNSMAIAKLLG